MNIDHFLDRTEPIDPGFYCIGAGPGDPELLTIKAIRILRASHVIFVPRSGIKRESLAASIIESVLPADGKQAAVKEIHFPMTRDTKTLQAHWRRAAEEVLAATDGKSVVSFVTLGDPGFYSTFFYLYREMLNIESGTEVVIVPGVSAINLAAAQLGIPLSLGDDRIAVLPLPTEIEKLNAVLEEFETIVVMKIGNRLEELTGFLKLNNLLSQSAFISRAGFNNEYAVKDMSTLSQEANGYLSIVIIKQRRFP